MTKRDDNNPQGISNRAAAWFIGCLAAGILIGFAAWCFAEFRFDRGIDRAVALLSVDAERTEARAELDLAAQETMATAAIVTAVLSMVSMVFIAATVWFTKDASVHAQRALTETLRISQRELMPYLVSAFSSINVEDLLNINEQKKYNLFFNISNSGQTPAYIKYIVFEFDIAKEIAPKGLSDKIDVAKVVKPNTSTESIFAYIPFEIAILMKHSDKQHSLKVEIYTSDIFSDVRLYRHDYIVKITETDFVERHSSGDLLKIKVSFDNSSNPLRSWDGATDGPIASSLDT